MQKSTTPSTADIQSDVFRTRLLAHAQMLSRIPIGMLIVEMKSLSAAILFAREWYVMKIVTSN